MTKLKNETKKVETAISKLNDELKSLDKNKIQETINDKKQLIELLETLMENETIQKRYPIYTKMKKFLYILPSILVAIITIGLIVASLIAGNITFTSTLPILIWATDYVAYHFSTMICDKKIQENEEFRTYNDLYGDKKYSAKRAVKDLHEAENDLEENKNLLNDYNEKEEHLHNLQGLLARLHEIRDNYIEQHLKEDYSQEEIEEISSLFAEETKPKHFVKK